MEAVSEPGSSGDVGDPILVSGASPRLSENGGENNFVAEKDGESQETEAAVVPSPVSASPLNLSPSQMSLSTEETVSTVLVQGGETGSTSESEKECTEVKTEEEFEVKEENVGAKDNSVEESPTGPDVSENSNIDETSDCKNEINTDEKMDPDIDAKEDIDTERESLGCKLRVSTADDLDEMMDIGTVDQVEQEAQMKEEEEQNSLMEEDSSPSPVISNTGKVKQEFFFSMS